MQVNSVGETSTQWREAFRTAGHWFATTSRVAPDQLDQPALGVWNVRDLLGHTSRALSTVSTYLATEAAGGIGVESAVDYFRLALRQAAPEEVAERGRTAGAALGAEPAAAIAELLDEVTERLVHTPDDAPVTTPFGVMALAEYLSTRAFELTVHTRPRLRAERAAQPAGAGGGVGPAARRSPRHRQGRRRRFAVGPDGPTQRPCRV
jgi:hypothetical protein